ncbi:DUF2946 domain-containing protein [Pseudomonas sp. P66]|jgi:hypothetical protein|uniref:DUF2946 domain-containing protein n=1 Tax=Pseudomonas arcuscaelestis TaxID=2710591 RepID=A0ABS2C541_9PSED|nr:DUF2946 domain-containing protein [Pseudomonas arcuscaelestis]MBM3106471.1 DUF2946 domain-containing protein [Pseudomonas arcuscaelestis]MBM5460987.1 DUF2946 domain-containing protein [Pseudomonas arcuscaelestis]
MHSHRLAHAWIACFAVLFNLLAMPLSAATPKTPSEQLLWGAFCSTGGTKLIAISLGPIDGAQQNDDHSTMQHCWCCSGAAPLLALPGHPPRFLLPAQAFAGPPVLLTASQPTPRQLWPALNPRASPLA